MRSSEKLIAVLAMAQMFGGMKMSKMFKMDDDPVVLDWGQIETEYNLIQQKESSLSRKDREKIIYLWENRIANESENKKLEDFE
jgi:membrane protein involved in colicin uptake